MLPITFTLSRYPGKIKIFIDCCCFIQLCLHVQDISRSLQRHISRLYLIRSSGMHLTCSVLHVFKVKTISSSITGKLQECSLQSYCIWMRTLLLLYLSHCFVCLSVLTFVHTLSSSTWSPLVSGCSHSCVGWLPPRTVTNLFIANNLQADRSNERHAAGTRWMNNLAAVGCEARVEPANPYRKPQWALGSVGLLDWGRPARLAQTSRKQLKLLPFCWEGSEMQSDLCWHTASVYYGCICLCVTWSQSDRSLSV